MTQLYDEVRSVLRSAPIRKRLKWLIGNDFTGYEKWLQHELTYAMCQAGHDVVMEDGIKTNAVKTIKKRMACDMAIRLKNETKDVFRAIELKVARGQTSALNRSLNDLVKLTKVKSSAWEYRSVTAMAVVNTKAEGSYTEFWKALKKNDKSHWFFEEMPIGIKGTAIYWFQWTTSPGKVNHNEYKKFVQFVRDTAVEHKFITVENRNKLHTPQQIEKKLTAKALKLLNDKVNGKR